MKVFLLFFALFTHTLFAGIHSINHKLTEKCFKYNIFKNSCKDIQKNLVRINISYYNLKGKMKHDGIIIVHSVVAQNVESIFRELRQIRFPIHGINPFKGGTLKESEFIPDDDYNFTGSFYCRDIQFGTTKSIHSYGMAIDINPLFNPYIQILEDQKLVGNIIPKDGVFHLNKNKQAKGTITPEIVEIFAKYGFNIWGGNWSFPIDYMHFQVSKKLAILLNHMTQRDAKKMFDLHTKFYNEHKREILEDKEISDLIILYNADHELFFHEILK